MNSVYQRVVAARAETESHVANAAVGGAVVLSLEQQAKTALQSVPMPQLVIVQTIDNDIQCDGTDADNVNEFGNSLKRALDFINLASPESRIFWSGSSVGRPPCSAPRSWHRIPARRLR